MAYKANVPQPADFLSDSQGDILDNFAQLDASFDIDHVKYSDPTADNGKHKTVTYVVQAPEPSTAANEVKSFSFLPSANIGELEFSRGPNDAVSTPLTNLHGTVSFTGVGVVDIIDLTGLSLAFCLVYAYRKTTNSWYVSAEGFYNSSLGLEVRDRASNNLRVITSGNKIQLSNTSGQTFDADWTIQFYRLS